ncbi:Protein of unknown function, partial [Gryllus bimaculatus]
CVFDLRVLVLRQYSVTTRLRYGTSSGLLQIFSYISTSPWIVVKPDWPAPLLLLLLLLGYSPLAAHAAAALPIDSREDTGVVALGDTHYGYEKENGHSVVFFVLKLTQRTDNVIEI